MSLNQHLTALLAVGLLTGCASHRAPDSPAHFATTTTGTTAAPTAAPTTTASAASQSSYEQGGIRFIKNSIAYFDGARQGTLLLEKVVPAEVSVGQPFEFVYNVTSLADCPLENVVIMDRVSANFRAAQSDPAPAEVSEGVGRWNLGTIEPRGKRTIRVRGAATEEGTISTCGWATFIPVICETVKVTKPALQLVKKAPAEVLLCDPIPTTLTVRNSGSSVLTNVRVTDPLPEGFLSDNKRELAFNVGTLRPGESKDLAFTVAASRTGNFVNTAVATADQNVKADASAPTRVRQPVLSIACEAPQNAIIGRPFDICYTISNKGDAPSAATVVDLAVPSGLTVSSSTGGRTDAGRVAFDVGALAPGASKRVCATVVAAAPGSFEFKGSAKGTCAPAVTTACTTVVRGVPAILLEVVDVDDPIEVGKNETYIIEVTNQGTREDTDIRLVCQLEDQQSFVSGSGPTAVSGSGKTITMAPLATLAPKAKATWKVVVRADAAANVRFKVSMNSAELTRPVEETESTNQY